MAVADQGASGAAVAIQHSLNTTIELLGHDGLVLTSKDLPLVADFAQVRDIGQKPLRLDLVEAMSATLLFLARDPGLGAPAPAVQLLDGWEQRLVLEIELEDGSNPAGFRRVDHQLPILDVDVVAQERLAARPLAF